MLFSPKTPIKLPPEVRNEVATRVKLTDPPALKSLKELLNGYKQTSLDVASKLDQLLVTDRKRRMRAGKTNERLEVQSGHHLLAALDILLEAEKVMIFTGQNTASGRVQPNGAVAAALFMDVLNRVKKVPVLVSDEINYRLTRCLLHPINPECARYAAHETLHAVNGELVRQLAELMETHQPDAAIFIGIPGRNSAKNYLDEEGNYLEEFNVAFDQALELCHRTELPTIAICSRPNHAGMGDVDFSPESERKDPAHAAIGAQCTILADDVALGAGALSELIVRAHSEEPPCSEQSLKEMIAKANKKTEDPAFKARQVRHTFRHRQQPEVQRVPMNPESCVARMKELQDAIAKGELVWPQEHVEHFRAYGPEVKYLVLYDSSDGALIAMKDFLGYLNARSNFVYDNTVVADHAKASYGDRGCELFTIIVDGIHYSARLGPDGIVMLCNTACSKSLDKAVEIVKKVLGKEVPVHVIDLIDTTGEAILKYGGEYPVILCTQQTAENGAYHHAVARKAKERGVPVPKLTVVACGDRNNPLYDGFDLARIINFDFLTSEDPIKRKMARNAIHHYLRQVPVNATKVFLCCTHFPALWELISDVIAEYWAPLGRSGPVPLVDPVKYQADKTAAFLAKTESANIRRHREPRSDKKHFLPRIEVHTTTSDLDTVRRSVAKYSKDMEVLNQYLVNDAPDLEDMVDGNEPMPRAREISKSTVIDTKGIPVTKVHFEKVPLKLHAYAVGVNEFGDPFETRETTPAH